MAFPVERLFISDLHLAQERPARVGRFLHLLRERAPRADALYILGDLFDAWVGDDDNSPPAPEVIAGLRALTKGGTRVFFMHGNRDFLIGRRFARASGCQLLQDPTVVDLFGEPTLLMHGDLLCTDDIPYQRFRRRIRNPLVRRLFLWKSLASRRAVADDYRRRSSQAVAEKAEAIMDVNEQTLRRFMMRYGVTWLIHGHTHRPADHQVHLDGRQGRRIVLAEWQEDRGEVLCVTPAGARREALD